MEWLSCGIKRLGCRIVAFARQFYWIPYCVPSWGRSEHWAVLRCLFTGQLIHGPDRKKLYRLIGKLLGTKYVFGFNSGREAIQAVLQAAGIGLGDRVILPSYCCQTVARAVLNLGAVPVYCDITEEYGPDLQHIGSLLDSQVRAVVFPHLFGRPAAIDNLERMLTAQGLRSSILVIDDAAQSLGARLHGKLVGTFGDAGIISFGPGKILTATGGGLLVTSSDTLANKLMTGARECVDAKEKLGLLLYWVLFRRWRRYFLPFFPLCRAFVKTFIPGRGKIRKLCNIDAAIAVEQLARLDGFIASRLVRKKRLDALFDQQPPGLWYVLPENQAGNDLLNVATRYVVRLEAPDPIVCERLRKTFAQLYDELGIEIQPLYHPIHMKPDFGGEQVVLPHTEQWWDRILQIPLDPSVADHVFDRIISRLTDLLRTVAV